MTLYCSSCCTERDTDERAVKDSVRSQEDIVHPFSFLFFPSILLLFICDCECSGKQPENIKNKIKNSFLQFLLTSIVVTYKNPRVFFNMLQYISNSIYCLKPIFLSKSRIILKLVVLILDVFLHLLIELKDLGQQQILRFLNLLIFMLFLLHFLLY